MIMDKIYFPYRTAVNYLPIKNHRVYFLYLRATKAIIVNEKSTSIEGSGIVKLGSLTVSAKPEASNSK